MVDPERRYGTCALNVEYVRLQIHSEYGILTTFSLQHWCTNAPQCFVYTYTAYLVQNFCELKNDLS